MRKVIIAIFLIAFFCFNLSFSADDTNIAQDSDEIYLAIENSPYIVYKDLIIKEGQTLSADPGVVIEVVKDISIIVEGRINLVGYPLGGQIVFKPVSPHQNYHKGFWNGIIIKSKDNNVITYAVIQHAKTGITLESGCVADISKNVITQNKTGMNIKDVKDFSVVRNTFASNFIDVECNDSNGLIEKNSFTGSLTSIKLTESYPMMRNNYFDKIYKYILESDNKKDLQLGENWWGTDDEEQIKKTISLEGKGDINFVPYLNKAPDLSDVGMPTE